MWSSGPMPPTLMPCICRESGHEKGQKGGLRWRCSRPWGAPHSVSRGVGRRGGEGYLSLAVPGISPDSVQKRLLELVQQCCPRAGQGGTGPRAASQELQAASSAWPVGGLKARAQKATRRQGKSEQ